MMMETKQTVNADQEKALEYLKSAYKVDHYNLIGGGMIEVILEDGSYALIGENGRWSWPDL